MAMIISDDDVSADDAFVSESFSDDEEAFVPTAATFSSVSRTKNAPKARALKAANRENEPNVAAAASSRSTASTPKRLTAAASAQKTVEEIYQKKTQLEHILLRPDTYIGSVEQHTQNMFVLASDGRRIVNRSISFVPGLFKIFDEILVNAADNKVRDATMRSIRVEIDQAAGFISIANDGKGIPIRIHEKEQVYVPELIFGHLLTSSNYDDDEKKVTGGRNGYGAKLCNIFSTKFVVETADGNVRKRFTQTFTRNMAVRSAPVIAAWSGEDFTKITFWPDLAKFRMQTLDDDIVALLKKRVYDVAGCVRGIKVYLNGTMVPVKTFKDYVNLYMPPPPPPIGVAKEGESEVVASSTAQKTVSFFYESVSERWEVALAVSPDDQFQQVSFVNSICTYKGGNHVQHVSEQVVERLLEAVKKKKKDSTLKPFQVKNHLSIFINCQIENPTFDSQTKENMTLKVSSFGSRCALRDEFIRAFIAKSTIIDELLSIEREKADRAMKKNDGHKNARIAGIPKLDDANFAGTRQAHKCTLILTEGDSAKALAVSGLSVVGRDYYGVYPLRGKLLNVRDASSKQITENQEISQIKQIMGLQHGKVYTGVDSLRYGHIMIMTDQDYDGSHIKGLIINFLDHFWPSLLRIPGFLLEFITPIVKCTRAGRPDAIFYTLPEYESWKAVNGDGKNWTIKYYKGLGTSTSADAKNYFRLLNRHQKSFDVACDAENALIDMVFAKKKANDRKDWLRDHYRSDVFLDTRGEHISLAEFVNKELILFSMADNVRSIPSCIDGLKPGHRKILFSCFKRNLRSEIKVAQLAGYVSEHSAYHHGEQSLCSTIVGMAQDFVGANNINLLQPIGQFGTRLQGGKDAASARYIFTALSTLTRLIFKAEDDAILSYLNDDGLSIEPTWYMPILPMVLINGSEGIGTGWSTSIPAYCPSDVTRCLKALIRGQSIPTIHPWFNHFHGSIEHIGNFKYKISGKYRITDASTIEIIELPVGTWTQTYKEFIEEQMVANENGNNSSFIRSYKEYHTDTTVKFVISLNSPDFLPNATVDDIEKRFRLSTTRSTSNLVCFSAAGTLKKYENIFEIIEEFYDVRLTYYQKRKEHLITHLKDEWSVLDNKVRFIKEIIAGAFVVNNRKKSDIVADLKRMKFVPQAKAAVATAKRDDDPDAKADSSTDESNAYNYLLSMPIWSLSHERIVALEGEKAEKERMLKILIAKTPKDMWIEDLDAFLVEWHKLEKGVFAVESARSFSTSNSMEILQEAAAASSSAPASQLTVAPKRAKSAAAIVSNPKPKKKATIVSSDDDDDEDAFEDCAVVDDADLTASDVEDDDEEGENVQEIYSLPTPQPPTNYSSSSSKPATKRSSAKPAPSKKGAARVSCEIPIQSPKTSNTAKSDAVKVAAKPSAASECAGGNATLLDKLTALLGTKGQKKTDSKLTDYFKVE